VSDIEHAKETITQLFSLMGITRVICIDDQYQVASIEDAIGLCSSLEPDKLTSIAEFVKISFGDSEDLWRQQLTGAFQDIAEVE
jgi:hypothetical protein